MNKRMLFAVLLMGLGLVAQAAQPASGHKKGAYLGARETVYPAWFKEGFLDLAEDVAEARAQGKRVLLLFTQDNCPYCNLLVERNLSQRDIEASLKAKFDVIAFNLWGDREVKGLDGRTYTEKAYGAALKVQFTPTLMFLDESGRTLLRLNGYVPPGRFKAALDWVADKAETRQPFRDFVAAREGAEGKGELTVAPFFSPPKAMKRPSGRPLALFFEQKDCPDCAVLHRRVLADPEVRALLGHFDVVQLDMWSRQAVPGLDGQPVTPRDLARDLGVNYAPGIVLFDAAGREIIRWEAGFRVFHTAGMLDYARSGAFASEPNFQRYLSARAEHVRESGRDVNIWRYADE